MKYQFVENYVKRIFFERGSKMISDEDIQLELKVSANHEAMSDGQYVLTLSFETANEHFGQMSIDMVGKFIIAPSDEQEELSDDKVEKFLRVNAAAMLFPFLRERVANASLGAGLSPLLLPPMNFVELYQDYVKSKSAGQDN